MDKRTDLNRGHVPLHVIEWRPRTKLGARTRAKYTAPDPDPVIRVSDAVPEPGRVVAEVVLAVRPAGDGCAAAVGRDDEAEDGEGEEDGDEEDHDEEVEPERPGDPEAGADEAGEGDDEDDEADGEERRLEEALAGGVALRHPQAAADERDGGYHREQVQEADHRVAKPVHLNFFFFAP